MTQGKGGLLTEAVRAADPVSLIGYAGDLFDDCLFSRCCAGPAYIVGHIYKQIGLLSQGHFIEVSRTDLIAGYQGQTALKVKKVIERAMNCTPFVRQYDILSNKWGVLLCQKEYQTNDIRRNSKNW